MQPSADAIPGSGGIIAFDISSSRRSASACSGPAPPYATSAKSRGSCPRSTVLPRMLPAILSFATCNIVHAASVTVIPSGSPIFSAIAASAPFRSNSHPASRPIRFAGPIRPSTRFASVTVGSVPPCP